MSRRPRPGDVVRRSSDALHADIDNIMAQYRRQITEPEIFHLDPSNDLLFLDGMDNTAMKATLASINFAQNALDPAYGATAYTRQDSIPYAWSTVSDSVPEPITVTPWQRRNPPSQQQYVLPGFASSLTLPVYPDLLDNIENPQSQGYTPTNASLHRSVARALTNSSMQAEESTYSQGRHIYPNMTSSNRNNGHASRTINCISESSPSAFMANSFGSTSQGAVMDPPDSSISSFNTNPRSNMEQFDGYVYHPPSSLSTSSIPANASLEEEQSMYGPTYSTGFVQQSQAPTISFNSSAYTMDVVPQQTPTLPITYQDYQTNSFVQPSTTQSVTSPVTYQHYAADPIIQPSSSSALTYAQFQSNRDTGQSITARALPSSSLRSVPMVDFPSILTPSRTPMSRTSSKYPLIEGHYILEYTGNFLRCQCNATYSGDSKNVRSNFKRHLPKPSSICPYCNKELTRNDNMKAHIRNFHERTATE